MSLAFKAAPFSENYSNMDDNKSIIEKKEIKPLRSLYGMKHLHMYQP